MPTMTHWSIRTQVVVTQPPTDDQVDELIDTLVAHGPTVSTDENVPTVGVRMDVVADTLTEAINAGVATAMAALIQVGIGGTLDAAEGHSYDDLDRQIAS